VDFVSILNVIPKGQQRCGLSMPLLQQLVIIIDIVIIIIIIAELCIYSATV